MSSEPNQLYQYAKVEEGCWPYGGPNSEWGEFTRYLEWSGIDPYAMRQVDVYANGFTLRFDRTNWWTDKFNSMAEGNLVKWSTDSDWCKITSEEFERVWIDSAFALNQPQHYGSPDPRHVPVWSR